MLATAVAVGFVGGFLGAPEARARSKKGKRAEAVRLYKQATKLYNEGRYGQAIKKFKRAYQIVKKPVLLFNIASSYERMGKFKLAVDYYRKYLTVCPEQEKNQTRAKIDNITNRSSELRVITSPTGAKVWINGKEQSQRTPASFSVSAGKVTLRVHKKGYESARRIFKAAYGKPIFHSINLKRLPPRATLKVKADVPGAEVLVDGKSLGEAPVTETISSGKHRIVVRKVGYRDVAQKVDLARGATHKVFAEMYRVARAGRPDVGGASSAAAGQARGAGEEVEVAQTSKRGAGDVDGRGDGRAGEVSLEKQTGASAETSAGRLRSGYAVSGAFLDAGGGLAVDRFGDPELEVEPTYSVALSGGYMLGLTRMLGLEMGAQLGLSSLNDNTLDRTNRLTFLDVLGFVGLRVYPIRNLFVAVRGAVGMLAISGLDTQSFLFEGLGANAKVDSTFSGLSVGGSLIVGYRVWRGLSICVVPGSVLYSPRTGSFDDFRESIKHVFRYNAQLAVLYDF
jgi:hypothetical protein